MAQDFRISQTSQTFRPENVDPAVADLQDLFETIGAAFDDLVSRGRESDAVALRDATEKFASIGSKLGVNSAGRLRALTEMKNKMDVATRFAESRILVDKLRSQAGLLGQISQLRGKAFDKATTSAGFTDENLQRETQRVLQPRGAKVSTSPVSRANRVTPIGAPQVGALHERLRQEANARTADQLRVEDRKQFLKQSPIRGPFGSQSRDVIGSGVPSSGAQATQDVRFGGMGLPVQGGSSFVAQHRGGVASPVVGGFSQPLRTGAPVAATPSASAPFTIYGKDPSKLGANGGAGATGQSPVVGQSAPLRRVSGTDPASGERTGRLLDASGTPRATLTVHNQSPVLPTAQVSPVKKKKKSTSRGPGGVNPFPVKTRGPGGVRSPVRTIGSAAGSPFFPQIGTNRSDFRL